MKRIIALLLCVMLTLGCLSGCSEAKPQSSGKLKVVTTIFPAYDWARQMLGDKAADADLTMLLDNGVDLHSYQPSADDIIKISSCDVFVYVGGASDAWVDKALKQKINKNLIAINLLSVLGDTVKEEEVVEGMEADKDDGAEEGPEYDEHVWLSLKNARTLCRYIATKLGEADPTNKAAYNANFSAYETRLNTLDASYQRVADAAKCKTLLFGDRFPFRYLADDYHLTYYAAFVGCSAESEASFETIAFLAKKTDELGLHAVMTLEGTDHKIAQAVIANTQKKNQSILSLNSMQSITSKDVKNSVTYLSIMESNLKTMTTALQ